jgi:hypothetical protein
MILEVCWDGLWTLSFGLSQLHSRGSRLVREVALISFVSKRRRRRNKVTFHPHLLVQATNERFLPARGTFKVGLASESHWLQQVLVLTVH